MTKTRKVVLVAICLSILATAYVLLFVYVEEHVKQYSLPGGIDIAIVTPDFGPSVVFILLYLVAICLGVAMRSFFRKGRVVAGQKMNKVSKSVEITDTFVRPANHPFSAHLQGDRYDCDQRVGGSVLRYDLQECLRPGIRSHARNIIRRFSADGIWPGAMPTEVRRRGHVTHVSRL